MRKCESIIPLGECGGHLGKYDSCRDEALDYIALESSDETTGTSDFQGHFSRVTLDAGALVTLESGAVIVLPGDYVVETASSGAVTVYDFDQASWDRASAAHEAWDAPEWCEGCTFDQRCQEHADMLAANT